MKNAYPSQTAAHFPRVAFNQKIVSNKMLLKFNVKIGKNAYFQNL
jgi:hypothetical protein